MRHGQAPNSFSLANRIVSNRIDKPRRPLLALWELSHLSIGNRRPRSGWPTTGVEDTQEGWPAHSSREPGPIAARTFWLAILREGGPLAPIQPNGRIADLVVRGNSPVKPGLRCSYFETQLRLGPGL